MNIIDLKVTDEIAQQCICNLESKGACALAGEETVYVVVNDLQLRLDAFEIIMQAKEWRDRNEVKIKS